jgi:hypothetical protein
LDSKDNDKETIVMLREALSGIVGADSEPELIKMKATLMMLNVANPNPDTVAAINAIDALLATIPKS